MVLETTYTMSREVGTVTFCYIMMELVQVKSMQMDTGDVDNEECDIAAKSCVLRFLVGELN
jgi:LEA14-like dessication related protein